jgi:hypothetical protein
MTKTKPAITKKEPPLHVELSAEAQTNLNHIRAARSWNKKTAVESALQLLAASLTKPRSL